MGRNVSNMWKTIGLTEKKADNKTRFDPRRSTKELAPLKEAYLNNWN